MLSKIIFPIIEISKQFEIRGSSLIALFNLHLLVKANQLYLQNCTLDDDSRTINFDRNRQRMTPL